MFLLILFSFMFHTILLTIRPLHIIEIVNKLSHNKYNYEHDIHIKEINPKSYTHTRKIDHNYSVIALVVYPSII